MLAPSDLRQHFVGPAVVQVDEDHVGVVVNSHLIDQTLR
jgi:hypothetical protein